MSNSLNPSRVKITTLNLFNYLEPPYAFYELDNIYSDKEWERKVKWISNCVQNTKSDIIAFQEVFSPEALQQQMYELGYKHFVCLDKPKIEHSYQYSSPVLALASKYPILESQLITVDESLIQNGVVECSFQFSRQPLMVTLQLGELGVVDFIVVHFKSQRTSIDSSSTTLDGIEAMGTWLSSNQRGFEANILYYMLNRRRAQFRYPCMVLGDFNQSIDNTEFDCFSQKSRISSRETDSNSLHFLDSWDLYCTQFDSANLVWSRPATHYHGAIGKVLDYILLSNELADVNKGYLKVLDYTTYDTHLINPHFDTDHLSTDHAAVTIEVGIK